jgi:dihydrofolate synthase/folylpolyglutamate synthase
MTFTTESDALAFIFRSYSKIRGKRGLDEHTRSIEPTRNLLLKTGLPARDREYVVITGSKGKGSTAVITAKLLEHLGHTTGLITSPHLVTWYERIRVNGRAIPQADFLRILSELAPAIAAEEQRLDARQYLSPQGIFLLMALRWWDEQGVTAAVVEVGRGGRFDDMSLVPNKLALFTPIFLEHTQYLGDSVARIAWHKSGIMPRGGYAYSLAQPPDVLDVLKREADTQNTEFFWLSSLDTGDFVRDTPDGIVFRLQRYGLCELPLFGHYQIDNATLAVQAAGNMHSRLPDTGLDHASDEYVQRIRQGLKAVRWPGRLQKLQESPQVFVEGAINPLSARRFLESVRSRMTQPLIIVAGVPSDRDVSGTYRVLAEAADALILTETDAHPAIHFPSAADALSIAQQFHDDVRHAPTLPDALDRAYAKAGSDGTVLLAVAQPLVGEAMQHWNVDTETI